MGTHVLWHRRRKRGQWAIVATTDSYAEALGKINGQWHHGDWMVLPLGRDPNQGIR